MKIVYILPDETVKTGGNWVTAKRLAEGFKKKGITVDIIEVKDASKEKLIKYDVIHAFHAFKSLVKISHLLKNLSKTVVVSFTGTDIPELQETVLDKEEIISLLNETSAVIVFHSESKEKLAKEGINDDKIKIIAQTTTILPLELRGNLKLDRSLTDQSFITFLFAAGIRSVKAPLQMIEMMSGLVKKVDNVRLIFIGPILDEDLGDKVKEKIEDKKWAEYLGEVSHKEAQDFILRADIILNTSISEGMASILLEAHQMGKPILASNIAGNRAIVTHGVDGYLFKDQEEFEYYASKLVRDSDLREKMGKAGVEARKTYDWSEEIKMYQKIYESKKL